MLHSHLAITSGFITTKKSEQQQLGRQTMSRFKPSHKRTRSAGSYEVNPDEPMYTLKYLGCCKLERKFSSSNGQICSEECITTIMRESKNKSRKVIINISTNIQRGLTIREPLSSYEESFQLHRIAYCCSSAVHPNVCAFIVDRGQTTGKDLECHAFICDKESRAKEVCVQLSKAFQVAYKNWQLQKKRIETSQAIRPSRSDSDLSTFIPRTYSSSSHHSFAGRIAHDVHHEVEEEEEESDADTPLLGGHRPQFIVAK